jgi:hypothetical protein
MDPHRSWAMREGAMHPNTLTKQVNSKYFLILLVVAYYLRNILKKCWFSLLKIDICPGFTGK